MICCSVADCELPHHAKSYCKRHYMQFRKWGSPHYRSKAANGENVGCLVPDCAREHKGLGYCDAHYRRLKRLRTIADMNGILEIRER